MPDPVTAIMAGSAIAGGANIVGSIFGANAQKDAATNANNAILAQRQQALDTFNRLFATGKDAVQPFIDTGTEAANQLSSRLPDLTAPIVMDQAALEQTPGYQFQKTQGLRAVTGQNVLRGLSGAQLKGAGDFVTGLADSNYKTQFDIANTNKTNAFNRLFQASALGAQSGGQLLNAATSGGNAILGSGATVGGQLSGNIIGAGNAEAARDVAIGQNVGNIASSYAYAPYIANKLYPSGSFPTNSGALYPGGGGGAPPPGATGMYGTNYGDQIVTPGTPGAGY